MPINDADTIFWIVTSQDVFQVSATYFGGLIPFAWDMYQRHEQDPQERVVLDSLYFSVKLGMIPFMASLLCFFCSIGGQITSWLPALYLGASFPILIQRLTSQSAAGKVDIPPDA